MFDNNLEGSTTGVWSLYLMNPIVVFTVLYLISAFSLYKIAKNLNEKHAWMAFIPLLQTILLMRMAHKPLWWIFLLLIPILDIFIYVMIFHLGVSKKTGYGHAWTIGLVMLPFIFLPITAIKSQPKNIKPLI